MSVCIQAGLCPSPHRTANGHCCPKRALLVEWLGNVRNQPLILEHPVMKLEGIKVSGCQAFLSFNICSSNEIPSENPAGSRYRVGCLEVREEEGWRKRPILLGLLLLHPPYPTTWRSGRMYIWFWASAIQTKSLIRNICSLIGQASHNFWS